VSPIRAVIFDLDGVLVDSEIWWDESRMAFADQHGRTWTTDDRTAVMGANSRGWSATMRERLGLTLADLEIERAIVDGVVDRYRREGPPLIPGAIDTVRRVAADVPVAVASSAHPEVIAAALDATGLTGVFSVVVSSDSVAHGKPAPDVYLEAARQLGCDPGDCLVIEDSRNGVLAARNAGMTVVLVPNESVPPAPGTSSLADVVLDRLSVLDLEAIADLRREGSPSPDETPASAAEPV
jgi:HAD superfamily hydrolase (TIGR01509 family)